MLDSTEVACSTTDDENNQSHKFVSGPCQIMKVVPGVAAQSVFPGAVLQTKLGFDCHDRLACKQNDM